MLSNDCSSHLPAKEAAALALIIKIKDAFDSETPGNDDNYRLFLALLEDFRDGSLDIQDLTTKCASLLRDHSHLLPAFNKFLPEGWSVISPAPAGILASSSSILSRREATRSRSSADADYARASAERRSLQFLTKVKIRFNGGETYANFVNALRLSSNDAEGLSQLDEKVATLLQGHEDLLLEFREFVGEHDLSSPDAEDFDESVTEVGTLTPYTKPLLENAFVTPPRCVLLLPSAGLSAGRSIASIESSPSSTIYSSPSDSPRYLLHLEKRSLFAELHCSPSVEDVFVESNSLMSKALDISIDSPKAKTPKPTATPLPIYPTSSLLPTSLAQRHSLSTSPFQHSPNEYASQPIFMYAPSDIEKKFLSMPNSDWQQRAPYSSRSFRGTPYPDETSYTPVIYPFGVAAGRRSILDERNRVWEALEPEPVTRGTKRSADMREEGNPRSHDTTTSAKRKKQVLRLSGGGSASGLYGVVGDGRPNCISR